MIRFRKYSHIDVNIFLVIHLTFPNFYFIIVGKEKGEFMNKEELLKLKEELTKLSSEEEKMRDLYLRGLANGKND